MHLAVGSIVALHIEAIVIEIAIFKLKRHFCLHVYGVDHGVLFEVPGVDYARILLCSYASGHDESVAGNHAALTYLHGRKRRVVVLNQIILYDVAVLQYHS